jgi:hypothetical protein
MNRFKMLIMTKNRFRLLLLTALFVAVTAFTAGISITYAQQDADAPKLTDEENAAAKAKKDADAARAIAKRAELLKQRQAAKDYIKKVVEGQQPAPDDAGKEGAK